MKLNFLKRSSIKQLPFKNFAEYYIGANVHVKGNCSTDQDMFVDGDFRGEITTTGLLELSNNSKVNADISARSAIFEGLYKGHASITDEVKIAGCADVSGTIEYEALSVQKGAIINAKLTMRQNS